MDIILQFSQLKRTDLLTNKTYSLCPLGLLVGPPLLYLSPFISNLANLTYSESSTVFISSPLCAPPQSFPLCAPPQCRNGKFAYCFAVEVFEVLSDRRKKNNEIF